MEESSYEFKILFSKAKEMNILGIEECQPNNIFCLVKKIEFYLYELHKENSDKIECFIKLCKDLKEKNIPLLDQVIEDNQIGDKKVKKRDLKKVFDYFKKDKSIKKG